MRMVRLVFQVMSSPFPEAILASLSCFFHYFNFLHTLIFLTFSGITWINSIGAVGVDGWYHRVQKGEYI